MTTIRGTFEDAILSLTVGQYENARKDLFAALKLEPQSRTAWGKYVKGERQLKLNQITECQKVFYKYGIEWIVETENFAFNFLIKSEK